MHSIDRQLLLGILALQNNFIDRNQLVGAFTVWVSNKARSLCEVLIENGAITDELGAVLVQLVNLHLQANRDDVHTCLLKLSSVTDVCLQLSQIKDDELKQSIGDLQPARDEEMDDPYRTEATGAIESHGVRYEIRRPLGRGGLGIVSIAHDRELNREVALKEIRPDQSHIESLRRKFLVEAEVTGNLEHPGIVPVYGLGVQPDGRPYYAMRFIQGDNLGVHIRLFHQKIKKGLESFDGSELRSLLRRFLDICDAISYAHSRGVLHRDLKPGNIMLGRFGETLVVDWGLAKTEGVSGASIQEGIDTPFLPKFKSDDHTQFGSTIGTPAYAPPEQIEGQLEQVNERSDVYGLGAILYELLCNAAPASGTTFEEVRSNIIAGRITPPIQREAAVPRALSDICMKALATAPSNRYDSPKSLMKDVECWLDDLPMTAHRENVASHFNRWLRKNRRVALTGLTSLVAIALLSGTYAWIADGLRRTAVNAKQAAVMAKEAAESAKQAAIEQRDHADRNFRLAREAVDQYLTDVSQDPQLAIAGFQPLRKKLLDDASDYYQQFLAQRGDDAGVLRESAAAHHRLASIYSVLGQFDRGLEAADRASQQYSLLASKDHSPLLQLEMAECELERAQLLTNVGKLTEAKVLAGKINEQLKSSNREPNGSLRLPAALAASYDLVASIAIRLNDRPTMTTAIEESQKLRQAIVSESPTLNALLALVATRMNASSSAAEQRNFEAAISSYQHSLSELEAHSDMDRSTAILAKRAELTHLLGTAYSGKGDDRSAIESFQKAIELREELVARNTVAGYQMDLAKSYSDLSVLRRRANQPEEATKDAEHSLELCKTVARIFPNSPEYQVQYAECLYRTAATVTGNQVLERLQLSESILKKIVDNREVRVQSGLLLGTVLDGTAKYFSNLKDFEASIAVLQKAIAVRQSLVDEFPAEFQFSRALAKSFVGLSGALQSMGNLEAAIAQSEVAKPIYVDLLRRRPEDDDTRVQLITLLLNVASTRRMRMEYDEALLNIQETEQHLKLLRPETSPALVGKLRNALLEVRASILQAQAN